MFNNRNILTGNRKYVFAVMVLVFISAICVAFAIKDNTEFDVARREVLLRRLGHEMLLQSGDSTSRVLAVKKIAENKYRISFENEFTFLPETLINTSTLLLNKDPLSSDYIVNILNCGNNSVVYGFAISSNKKEDIITCKGRAQPTACYMIDVTFKPTRTGATTKSLLLAACPFWKIWRPTPLLLTKKLLLRR